jgi:hypothetical protein
MTHFVHTIMYIREPRGRGRDSRVIKLTGHTYCDEKKQVAKNH